MHDDAYIGGLSENNINALCMTISGGRTKQLDIFCHVTGFTSDFLSFIVVELIRFFHGAIQLYAPMSACNDFDLLDYFVYFSPVVRFYSNFLFLIFLLLHLCSFLVIGAIQIRNNDDDDIASWAVHLTLHCSLLALQS